MDSEAYYGSALPALRWAEQCLLGIVGQYPAQETVDGVQPILYCKSRIKSPQSMIRKLSSRGLATDSGTALAKMHDAVGVRVVCSFVDNVYEIAGWLSRRPEFTIIGRKDYIAYPKENGYRSLHLIVRFFNCPRDDLTAEIQLRTIAIDFWAALEHQIKYKRAISHERTIRAELKRCADEIASVDMSMQTIRDILRDGSWEDKSGA